MNLPFKTICTVLTPPGAGGIALLRVDGPKTISIVQSVFRPRSGRGVTLAATNRVRYGALVIDGETIDEVLLTVIPTSQTHAVEIACHGGVRVIERVLVALIGLGAEFVEGDSTLELAWPADTMIEREALDALCRARTSQSVRFAARQRTELVRELTSIAEDCAGSPDRAASRIDALIATAPSAMHLVNGAAVALIGPPNSGKSSLFNAMVGRAAAVVSPVAGTTRDWVCANVEMDGVPITLIDTAGIHETHSSLEAIALKRGQAVADGADLLVLVLDGSIPPHVDGPSFAPQPLSPRMVAVTKSDREPAWHACTDLEAPAQRIHVSAITGEGVAQLAQAIAHELCPASVQSAGASLFTTRQVEMATQARHRLGTDPIGASATIKQKMIFPIS